jgi:hypothetical protein
MAYATPVPDLKNVMELGVWHLASTAYQRNYGPENVAEEWQNK